MKNFFISLTLIFLAQISITTLSCYGEDFFFDTSFVETKNKVKVLKEDESKNANFGITEKKKLFKREKVRTKFNYTTNKEEVIPRGYYGKLPDIEADFSYKQETKSKSTQQSSAISSYEADLSDDNLKKAPFDDSLFLDIIVKKEKTSNYVNDLQRSRHALLNLKKCIEEQGDIQRFNGCVNLVDLYSKNLKTKYENKSESLKASYIDILTTAYYAKVTGNLLYDSNYYARYIPTQQGKYSKENIEKEKQDLLNRINKTLFLIYQES